MFMLLMIYVFGNLYVVFWGIWEIKEILVLKLNMMIKWDIFVKLIELYVDNDLCVKYFR